MIEVFRPKSSRRLIAHSEPRGTLECARSPTGSRIRSQAARWNAHAPRPGRAQACVLPTEVVTLRPNGAETKQPPIPEREGGGGNRYGISRFPSPLPGHAHF